MEFYKDQLTTWSQVFSNYSGPFIEIGQPGNSSIADEYRIKLFLKMLPQIVDIALNKANRLAALLIEPAGCFDGIWRKIYCCYLSAQTRQ